MTAEIAEIITGLLAAPARLGAVRLLAIDGPSGSGKSTLAERIVTDLRAAGRPTELVSTDRFATWDDPVSWWPRLRDGVLVPLANGEPGRYRSTEWTDGIPGPGAMVDVPVPDVLVCEGVSAGRRAVRPLLSGLVWVEVADPAVRLDRAVARDGEPSRAHLAGWQAFETGWFAVDGTRNAADHIVETGL